MIKYSLYITEKQDQELRKIASDSSSVSEHIRTAINNYLREIQKEKVSLSPSAKESKNE